MNLKEFEEIETIIDIDEEENNSNIGKINIRNVDYYLKNFDILLDNLSSSHHEYLDLKAKYQFKKYEYLANTDWNEENALRQNNGLPKATNMDMKNSIINLKIRHLYDDMKSAEHKYNIYKSLYDFISNNYGLLLKYDVKEEDS